MAARTPRRSFATPFVVTLAAAPAACYVQSSTGPTAPPPSQPPAQTTQTDAPQPTNPPQHPPVIVNPPMPQQNPPPTTTPTPTPPASQDVTWTVFKGNDGCMAAVKSECPPKAICNPPPPFKYTCPENTSLDKPVTVVSHDGGASCMLEFPMPTCPPNTACNPPRPRPVTCPKR